MRNFHRCFELLLAVVDDVAEETLTTLFMNGLTDDIHTEVKMFPPHSLRR